MHTKLMLATMTLLLAAPLALAQNDTGVDGDERAGDREVNRDIVIDPPDQVDVDVTERDAAPEPSQGDGDVNVRDTDPQEAVGGWGTATVVIVIVGALLLVALIVGLATRDRWYP